MYVTRESYIVTLLGLLGGLELSNPMAKFRLYSFDLEIHAKELLCF